MRVREFRPVVRFLDAHLRPDIDLESFLFKLLFRVRLENKVSTLAYTSFVPIGLACILGFPIKAAYAGVLSYGFVHVAQDGRGTIRTFVLTLSTVERRRQQGKTLTVGDLGKITDIKPEKRFIGYCELQGVRIACNLLDYVGGTNEHMELFKRYAKSIKIIVPTFPIWTDERFLSRYLIKNQEQAS